MVTPPALDVHLYGTRIATLTRGRSDHRLTWIWTGEAAQRWGLTSRIVSHGIPTGAEGTQVPDLRTGVFTDGLLPEGSARLHYAVNAAIDPEDTFALLARYGQDTAGALVFVPHGHLPDSAPGTPHPLDGADVRELLEEASSSARRGALTSTSLAGLVPKIALDRTPEGHWLRPAYGAPSTWIVKIAHPADSEAADVVDTETACLDLGRRIGVTTIAAEILHLDGLRAIAVSRYDRPVSAGGQVQRTHQEDLAQALGIATADPTRKFQRGRRIPSWSAAADVLRAGGGALSPLARLVCFSYLVGNTDHHAKNTSFLRFPDGRVALAPAYDIAAHLHHPGTHRTALDLAGESAFETLTIDHVVEEITSWDIPRVRALAAVTDVVTDLRDALGAIDRDSHPGVGDAAWAVLDEGCAEAAEQLRS